MLGHRLIKAHPDDGGSEFYHGEVVCPFFLVSRGDTAEVFDFAVETLNGVTHAVLGFTLACFPVAVGFVGNVRYSAEVFDPPAQSISVIGFVSKQYVFVPQIPQQVSSCRAVCGLSGRQVEAQRQTTCVNHTMDLGR